MDPHSLFPGSLLAVARVAHLRLDVDDPARVDDVVRRVQDAATVQVFAVVVGEELVVGPASHHAALELRNGPGVQHTAQGAGRQDVAVGGQNRVGGGHLQTPVPGAIEGIIEYVGDDDSRVLLHQVLAQMAGHLAESLDGHGPAAQAAVAPDFLGTGLHPHVKAQPGHDGGIPAASEGDGQAGDVSGLLPHEFQVAPRRSNVGGGQVAAAKSIDGAAVGSHQGLGLIPVRVANNHALASPEVETGGRRLVGHRAGEAQRISKRLGLALIGPHAGTATRRPQRGVMNSDYGLQSRGGVGEHRHLFMALVAHLLEYVHFRHPHYVSGTSIIEHSERQYIIF